MVSRKDRRKSGYVTPDSTIPRKGIIKYDFFINDFYDDWVDYRDGFRDWFRDFKKIKSIDPSYKEFNERLYEKRAKMNAKQKKLLKRRKAMKRK
ncbi:MAG: hypothetical protein AABX00_00460 [Nanoarchaeota archaeon]